MSRRDTPRTGVHVIAGEVPEGIVPPSTSMATPGAATLPEEDEALLYEVRVTLTYHLSDHVGMPPEQRAAISRALTDAIAPDILAALTAARDGTEKLRRQVLGFRGMKDVYLRERNAAQADLIEAERLIELLCDDREAGKKVVKAALTEQRERGEKAEAAIERARAALAKYDELKHRDWDDLAELLDGLRAAFAQPKETGHA